MVSSKKFKSGLESLFDNAEREFEQDSFAIAEQQAAETAGQDAPKRKSTAKRKGGRGRMGKNFTSDLDSLFDVAMEERRQSEQRTATTPRPKTVGKVRERKTLSGLDALIRQTAELDASGRPQKTTKRVTFAYNRQKLDKLKRIARNRRLYLKDIMKEIVNDYLARNEGKKP